MKAVIYARYSSLAQNEQSIDEQVQRCRIFCQFKQFDIIHIYIDKAKSGSKNIEKRTEFLKMIQDSYTHTFNYVIVYKLDRFSRDEYDTKEYEKILKNNGVDVLSATESYDPNTVEGFITKTVLQMVAQIMPKQLSPRVKDGMNMNASKFLSIGGNPILGYKTSSDKKIIIEEKERPIVEMIFKMYADRYNLTEIASTLNEKGYRTKKNQLFTKKSFYSILSNKKYIGTYTYKGEETPNVIPSIIDKELFDRVQDRYNNIKHIRKPMDYILSGKLFLEEKKMTGQSTASHYYYYVCEGYRIKKETIENQVISVVREFLKSDFKELSESFEKYSQENKQESEYFRLEKRNKEIDKLQDKWIKIVENGDFVPSVVNRELKALEDEKNENLQMMEILKKTDLVITKEMVIACLKDFILAKDDGDEKLRRTLITQLIKDIHIQKNGNCDIYLNFPIKQESHNGFLHKSLMVHHSRNISKYMYKYFIYL